MWMRIIVRLWPLGDEGEQRDERWTPGGGHRVLPNEGGAQAMGAFCLGHDFCTELDSDMHFKWDSIKRKSKLCFCQKGPNWTKPLRIDIRSFAYTCVWLVPILCFQVVGPFPPCEDPSFGNTQAELKATPWT